MVKLKLFIIAGFIMLTAIVLNLSLPVRTSASGDILQEIANYKTWQRINREPIRVDSGFQIDGASGAG